MIIMKVETTLTRNGNIAQYVKFTVMNKENDFYKGIMVGFAVSTIGWCLLWAFVVGKIDRVHKQELDYIIEKHQTK